MSPDTRWVAFNTNQAIGKRSSSFRSPLDQRWQVSVDGGVQAAMATRWKGALLSRARKDANERGR